MNEPTLTELYNRASGTWSPTPGALANPRTHHTATPLPDGKVLVAGGSGDISAELYTPAAEQPAGRREQRRAPLGRRPGQAVGARPGAAPDRG